MSGTETAPYEDRLARVREKFNQMPRGAQTQAGIACGISTSYVSNVLNGHVEQPDVLEQLEAWVDSTPATEVTQAQRSTRVKERQRLHAVEFVGRRLEVSENAMTLVDEIYEAYKHDAATTNLRPLGYWTLVGIIKDTSDAAVQRVNGEMTAVGLELSNL